MSLKNEGHLKGKNDNEFNVNKIHVRKKGLVKPGCKQVYDKVNYCTFCGTGISSKITRHLFSHKAMQPVMREIDLMPKRSKQRMVALEILVNEGNFKHNIKVTDLKKGDLVIARRDMNRHNYSQYLPCIKCKKFLLKTSLWAHKKTCVCAQDKSEEKDSATEQKSSFDSMVRQGRMMLNSALLRSEEKSLASLFKRMRDDEITQTVKKDKLIMRYATLRMASLGEEEDQKVNDVHRVSQGARTLARLVIESKCINTERLLDLDALINPETFDLVVETAHRMSVNSTSLGKRLGDVLSHASAMKIGLALRNNNRKKQTEAENFNKLLVGEWNLKVNSACTKKRNRLNRNKVRTLPLTEDLKTLRNHIISNMEKEVKALKESKLPEHWTSLAKNTMCRLILFNMRRQAEVKDLKVTDYMERPDWSRDQTGEFQMALSSADKILAKR